jgi:HK97 family phage portal protein
MPFWDRWAKQEDSVSGTVPMSNDLSGVEYPDGNFENFAAQGYGKNEIVHACIRELAVSTAAPRYFIHGRDSQGGLVEQPASPYAQLLERPNAQNDFYQWVERFITYLYVAGNVYVLKERSRTNKITALWLLRPDRVTISPNSMGAHGYLYTIDGKEYHVTASDMAHMAFPNPGGDVYGLSPLSVMAKTVNLDLAMTDFAKLFFQNAGVPSGLLKVKRRISSQEEASVIRSRWRSSFGGANNMHRVAILDNDAEYQAMAAAQKDMDLKGLHDLTETRICAVFGVPPILIGANVGLARSTYSNYREARLSFHSETVEPLVSRFVRFINSNLSPDFGNDLKLGVDFSQVLGFLDDRDSQTTRVSTLFTSGIITLNEAREQVGQDAVETGNVRRIDATTLEVPMVSASQPSTLAIADGPIAKELTPAELDVIKAPPKPTQRAVRLTRRLLAERDALTDEFAVITERYYRTLRDRSMGVLGRMMERSHPIEWLKEQKGPDDAFGIDAADALIHSASAKEELNDILYHAYVKTSKATYQSIDDSGLAGSVRWSAKDPVITGILTTVDGRVQMIHRTTQKMLKKAIETAMGRGYTIEQLTRGVPGEHFPGVQSLMNEPIQWKARRVARTEIMRSQNLTTTRLYEKQGFRYVQASDLDGGVDNYVDPADGRTCSQRNGQIYRTNEAENVMDHPNGTLTWMPLPSDYNPEGVRTPQVPDVAPEVQVETTAQNYIPRMNIKKGVSGKAASEAGRAVFQTVNSLKSKKMQKRLMEILDDPETGVKVTKANARSFGSGRKKASGFYNTRTQDLFVADNAGMWSTHHEIGHALTLRGGATSVNRTLDPDDIKFFFQNAEGIHSRIAVNKTYAAEVLGIDKAVEFYAEMGAAWNSVAKKVASLPRRLRSPEAKRPSVTVSNYAETNPAEYMAEGFKYAITDPKKLRDADPALYKVMTKYFIKKTPAKDITRDVVTEDFTPRMNGVSSGRIDPSN